MDNTAYKENRIMGIDYGEKRIGIALTDPLLTFAYPFKTLLNDDKFWNEFTSIIKEKRVTKIILGLPSTKQKSSAKLAEKIKIFKTQCEIKLNLQIIYWDEQYTSAMAKEIVLKSVAKKSKRKDKSLLDQNSAAIILQEYLNVQ